MINLLPADIFLHILSFLPLSSICQLLKTPPFVSCRQLIRQELMSRIKKDKWKLSLYKPSAYFAMLCNREIMASTVPIATLVCSGYSSEFEHLRFEPLRSSATIASSNSGSSSSFHLSDINAHYETISIYCSHWINMFKEDDAIKLFWRQGSQQLKQDPFNSICIQYNCQSNIVQNCSICDGKIGCQKHASANTMSTIIAKTFQITSIQVSLDWIRRGFS